MSDSDPVDAILPEGKWEFGEDVTAIFDDMLARSIPQYDVMRGAVAGIAARYVKDGTAIVDLGCSRGEALARFVESYGVRCRYVGIDVSGPMLEACRQRFADRINDGLVDIRCCDLRHDYPAEFASVTLCVLSLQFTPIEYRQKILRQAFDHTTPGGCFVLVEKLLGSSADIDEALTYEYYRLKRENGYSQEQIDRKRLSLEGVLVPVTAKWNEDLLHAAGFEHVECFWRWMNFAAWIAVRS